MSQTQKSPAARYTADRYSNGTAGVAVHDVAGKGQKLALAKAGGWRSGKPETCIRGFDSDV